MSLRTLVTDQFENDPGLEDPRGRALVMAQLGASMAEILVGWEPRIKGSPEGDEFLAESMDIITCVGLSSIAPKETQVQVLRLASALWLLDPALEVPASLCRSE